jgi:hypothetical protein
VLLLVLGEGIDRARLHQRANQALEGEATIAFEPFWAWWTRPRGA